MFIWISILNVCYRQISAIIVSFFLISAYFQKYNGWVITMIWKVNKPTFTYWQRRKNSFHITLIPFENLVSDLKHGATAFTNFNQLISTVSFLYTCTHERIFRYCSGRCTLLASSTCAFACMNYIILPSHRASSDWRWGIINTTFCQSAFKTHKYYYDACCKRVVLKKNFFRSLWSWVTSIRKSWLGMPQGRLKCGPLCLK